MPEFLVKNLRIDLKLNLYIYINCHAIKGHIISLLYFALWNSFFTVLIYCIHVCEVENKNIQIQIQVFSVASTVTSVQKKNLRK